jgi:4-amino-4-deoxy-L-arabinose transferase-like glycosyltransferase
MNYVSLIVEFLRGRPRLVFWFVALAQAVLWIAVPALSYSTPPGDVPLLLAIGHELLLGSYQGPPLAFWLGEAAFRIGGAVGVYVLAQACIVTAYWAVFTLGRAIVGTRHAVLGVLLMVGIASLTVPTPNFGPAVLAAPLWALALLHYWRALGEGRRGAWFLLAIDLGLLLLASYVGLVLIALLILFTLATRDGWRALRQPEPWFAGLLLAAVLLPHALWLARGYPQVLDGLMDTASLASKPSPGVWLASTFVVTHLGLILLVVLASGWPTPRRKKQRVPEIDRIHPASAFACAYIYVFAIVPALVAVAVAAAAGRLGPLERVTPFVLLSGLAFVVAGGDRIFLYRERMVSSAWLGLLLAPPAIAGLSVLFVPWVTRAELGVAQPSRAEGVFFAETFQRRTGKPLAFVAGDPSLAPRIALAAPGRPRVYFDWAPARGPWATAADVKREGGVLVWPAPGNTREAPAELKAQFPNLVAEVPRTFQRPVRGFLDPVRVGWAVIRPGSQ